MNNQTFVLSEIELRFKPKIPFTKRPQIICAEDAYKQFLLLLDQSQFNIKEEAAVLFLGQSKRVIGGYKLSSGGINSTVVDIRIILAIAVKCLATGMILAHTHPSGELHSSKKDLELTIKLMDAGKLLEIILYDHLIITRDAYLSLAQYDLTAMIR